MEKNISDFMEQVFKEHDGKKGVLTCLPFPCGTGKSRWVADFIRQSILKGECILIVTDTIERMNGYIDNDDFLTNYIETTRRTSAWEHPYDIRILHSSNIRQDFIYLYSACCLVISTQRYFSMSADEINRLCKRVGRKKIIFDERPILTEQVQIGIDTLNRIDNAFVYGIDNNQDLFHKEFLITELEAFRRKILELMTRYEALNDKTGTPFTKWHFVDNDSMTSNDEKFFTLIDIYKKELIAYDHDCIKELYLFKQLIYEGGTFVSIKRSITDCRGDYKNYFTLVVDNSDKISKVNTKAYCLCATADIDPMFDNPVCEIIDCSAFSRNLNLLTINLVNVNTSKTRLNRVGKCEELVPTISRDAISNPGCKTIFTHKQTESLVNKAFPTITTDHFGNIAGKNAYRHETSIAQIGLNRYPDIYYRLSAQYNELLKHSGKCNIIIGEKKFTNTMNRYLLQDIEQNIFRTKIREKDNKDEITYIIYFDTDKFSDLVTMIKQRYEPLGATINLLRKPASLVSLKASERRQKDKKPNHRQRIKQYINSLPPETIFTNEDICDATHLSIAQLNNAKKGEDLHLTLESMKIGRSSYKKQ